MKTPDMERKVSPIEEVVDIRNPEQLLKEIGKFGMDLRDEALNEYKANFIQAMDEATAQMSDALSKHQEYIDKAKAEETKEKTEAAKRIQTTGNDFLSDEVKRIKRDLRKKLSTVN